MATPSQDEETATEAAGRIKTQVNQIQKVVTIDEDNDPNDLIGRPNGYTDAAVMYDSRVTCDELGADCGATIEVWPTAEDAKARSDYIQRALKGNQILGTEYHTLKGCHAAPRHRWAQTVTSEGLFAGLHGLAGFRYGASPSRDHRLGVSYYDWYMVGETIHGEPVTEEQIQDWADEAERGYPVERLRQGGRPAVGDGPGEVIAVRMDETLLAALAARAERDQVSRSEAIRAAVRAWIDAA